MNSRLEIKLDKNGNIKTLKTPYDNDSIINNPIHSTEIENHNTLLKVFAGFRDSINTYYNR